MFIKTATTLRVSLADQYTKDIVSKTTMASALGTTIAPGGETGTVTSIQHMPDQIPDNPSTIVANTSIETIENILYRNWIWRNTFQVDASMRPGFVFGTIQIHPNTCNDYVAHIARMFLTYTGSMKIRTRFMATFQFGGSFRLGFLPPKFTLAQIQSMPIQTLTAYPNIDLDPKNTEWIEFQASDERNIMFHWMTQALDKPEDFSGWYVFYVAAPLVLSGTDTTVSLLVEAAGGFNFSQLSPISDINVSGKGWAGNKINLLSEVGIDDGIMISACIAHQTALNHLPIGYFTARGLGGKKTADFANSGSQSSKIRYLIDNIDARTIAPGFLVNYTGSTTAGRFLTRDGVVLPLNMPKNKMWCSNFNTQDNKNVLTESKIIQKDLDKWWTSFYFVGRTGGWDSRGPVAVYPVSGRLPMEDYYFIYDGSPDPSYIQNPKPQESMVTFNTLDGVNIQTRGMRDALMTSQGEESVSQIYQLRSVDGIILALFRLTPMGIWTTSAHTSEVEYPPGTLEYLQDLPMSSPLPPLPTQRRYARLARKLLASNPEPTPDDWDANVYSMLSF